MSKKALGRGLPGHIKEREMRTEFQKILDTWRSKGYNVARLDGILELDIDTVSQAFTLYDNDIRNLIDITEIVNMMETEGFEGEIENIRTKLMDPEQINDILKEVHDLDSRIREASTQKVTEKQKVKIDKWSKELDEGKSELMDLWEESEQEAIVEDPSKVEEARQEVEKKEDGALGDRLSNIKDRLNKLALRRSIPLRSDKVDIADDKGQPDTEQTPAESPPEQPKPDTAAMEPPAEIETPKEEPATPEPPQAPESPPPEPEIQIEPEVAPQEEAPTPPPEESGGSEAAPEVLPETPQVELTPQQKDDLEEAIKIAKEMYMNKDYDKAIEYFNMALEIDPMNSDAIFFKKRAESRKN
jgi:tetratricopeptide (TPR) repeat protein